MQPPTEHARWNSTLPFGFLVGALVAVAVLLLSTLTALAADMIKVQGESMTLATGISVVNDSSAEPTGAGKAIRYTASATARQNVTYTKGATQIVVRARKEGTNANHPLLKVFTKTGTQSPVLRGIATVSSTSYQEYAFPFSANSGTHQVQVRGATPEIYTMNPNGQGIDRLTNNPANDHSPDWQPLLPAPKPTPPQQKNGT